MSEAEPEATPTEPDRRLSLPAFAVSAMVAWVALEFALRRGLVPVLAPVLGSARGADALVLLVGFPLIAGLVALLGRRAGVEPADWDYAVSVRAVGMGVVGLVIYFVVFVAATLVYTFGVGGQPSSAVGVSLAGLPVWAAALLVAGNGVAVPVAEELAWRAVIQTALAEAYGTYAAVALAGAGFVLKHLLVDLSAPPLRVASLVILAVVLGALRARYGTASSTVAHLGGNLLATAALVV